MVRTTKNCYKCGRTRKRLFFYADKSQPDGKGRKCKDCAKSYYNDRTASMSADEREKFFLGISENAKTRRSKDPRRYMLNTARKRAKNKGLDFSLKKKDIVIPDICPVLGIHIKKSELGFAADHSPSIDRTDPSKGYIPSNVAVISHRANSLKSNATAEELELVAAYIREKSNN